MGKKKDIFAWSILIIVVGAFISSCISLNRELSNSQRLYAVESEYVVAATAILPVLEDPGASAETKQFIRDLDNKTFDTLMAARKNPAKIDDAVLRIRMATIQVKMILDDWKKRKETP